MFLLDEQPASLGRQGNDGEGREKCTRSNRKSIENHESYDRHVDLSVWGFLCVQFVLVLFRFGICKETVL